MLKAQKNTVKQLNYFFIYSFLIYPLFRSCFITVTANFLRAIFDEPSVGTFFVSAIALVVLGLMIFMVRLCAFATGSSPSPNISNLIAIWAPNTWESVFFDVIIVIGFLIIELESTAKKLLISILLIVRFVILITLVFLHIDKIYYIRFSAYQFVSCMFLTFDIYMIVLIILSFKPGLIPFAGIISIWLLIPLFCYIGLKIRCMHISKTLLKKLKSVDKPEVMPKQGTKAEEEMFSDIYSEMDFKTSKIALMAVRTACYWSLDCFADCSLLKYVIHTFPDLQFQMLYMAFLIPDNIGYLKTLIDSFLSKQNPSFLQAAILYQLLTSIQESSNEGCQAISREISKQTLASIKCEQVLSKFWSGCYKGDISQMARSAFTLHQNLKELSDNWKQLVIRYPYSTPIIKEYIKYLVGVGTQHRIAESILKIHPKLMDNVQSNNSPDANEINESILHQSVEDAVDRRPIISLHRARVFIFITVFLAFLFIICAIVLAFIFINISYGMSNYLYYSDTTCSLIVHSPNLLQKIIVSGTPGRKSFFNHAKTLDTSITGLLSSMPSGILKNNTELSEDLYSQVNKYNVSSQSGLVKALRLYSYYARSVPFVPDNDTLVFLMSKNTFGIAYSVFLASDAELSSIQNIISKVKKYIPIYYGVIWGVMLIIMIPFVFNALQNVKSELKYIFNLYLTIPRSVITEFMDPDSKNKKGKTGLPITNNLLDLDQNDVNNQATVSENENKAAENLKLLVHDQSTTQSVLPNNFQIKVWIILTSVTFTLLIGATIEVSLFTSFVNEMMVEFKTLQILSRRIIGCSVALQGIVSNFSDFPRDFCESLLNSAKKQNSQLLLAIDQKEVSQKFLTYQPVYDFVHANKCNDTTNVSCWSYANIMDSFLIFATQAYNNSISDDNFFKWTVLYNDYLYPESYQLHKIGYDFIIKQFKTERLILL
ncbi:hypothetical protein TVAG_008920 [Trichomonas vaginalis G3]|uniref:Uncharacterized protein n=1 Tax=Trichomonas vaginalis (strain ATCC PRA-98 / G3) TaxID=412133 RepID=A2FGT7_TRIV3|nr:hypothetical protein TVAGG3_0313670 [Trichomonas vaginalis G3]EAX95881.1 hypothetical protein TVAG_008920 [Trichomonas vaginalis G3]KAI5528792.1 hypothetical protein TVAGG3_0313670 [Trichomonas vaginalis G3]|eukprot:XP_001308811.1 hypothetical protein [Trichomonas vaginalis G3]